MCVNVFSYFDYYNVTLLTIIPNKIIIMSIAKKFENNYQNYRK